MIIAITGATGRLGRLVIDNLLGLGVAPADIIAAVRDPAKAADHAEHGLQVRHADYDRPETLGPAFLGAERLLLISSDAVGRRVDQHRNVIEAAVLNDVRQIAYTSIVNADTSTVPVAGEHRATEAMIRETRVPFAFLRNSWYLENYTDRLPEALRSGEIIGAAGEGRVSAATRADFAAAAAAALAGSGTGDAIHELGGDEAFTLAEFAAEASRVSGTEVRYRDLAPDEYARALRSAGVPPDQASMLAESDACLARGELRTDSGALSRLAARPATTLTDAIAAAVGAER